METLCNVECYGELRKEERLTTVNAHILPGTLVLEAATPFPAYHGPAPDDSAMGFVYLLTRELPDFLAFMRITGVVRQKLGQPFDAVPAHIRIGNEAYACIRLRNLPSFELIKELQCWYRDYGVAFLRRRNYDEEALVEVRKIFHIRRLDDNIFSDLDDTATFYLRVGRSLTWSEFKRLTGLVKSNLDDINFDCAQVSICLATGVFDLVRVFDMKTTPEKLRLIHEKYLAMIERFG